MLASYLGRIYGDRARCFNRSELDIGNPNAFNQELERNEYSLVINAAGYAGGNRRKLFEVNAFFPAEIARICGKKNIPFVYLSTGRVFDGKKGRAYIETDSANPLDDYGLSKYVGEKLIENELFSKKYYIFRLAQLLGIRQRNAGAQGINRLIEQILAGESVSIADDIISTPAYAADIAGMIRGVIEQGLPHGLYHLITRGSVSLYDLVCFINDQFDHQTDIQAVKHIQLGLSGRRALNTSLGTIRTAIGPRWQDSCDAFVRELKEHKSQNRHSHAPAI
jgi:dTDP-4-dehydrorhamnose reductase